MQNNINKKNVEAELKKVIQEITELGLSIERTGNWLWLDDSSNSHKVLLEKIGCKWSHNKDKWFYKPSSLPETKRIKSTESMDSIRKTYGSHIFNTAS